MPYSWHKGFLFVLPPTRTTHHIGCVAFEEDILSNFLFLTLSNHDSEVWC